jgi:hypothetical protein
MIPFSLVYSAVTSFLGSATRSTNRFVFHVLVLLSIRHTPLLRCPTLFPFSFFPSGLCYYTQARVPFSLSFLFSILVFILPFVFFFFFQTPSTPSRFVKVSDASDTLPDCLVCLFPRGRFIFTPSRFTTWHSNDGRCYRETNPPRLWLLLHICGGIMGRGDVAVPTPRRNIAAWDV